MNHRVYLAVLFIIFFLTGRSQQFADMQLRHQGILCMTALDTLLAARCPVLTLQEHLKDRSLPTVIILKTNTGLESVTSYGSIRASNMPV